MAWIESHQVLERHPKVLHLGVLMGWSRTETIGALHRFWWWVADCAEDGDLRKYNDAVLAACVDVAPERASEWVNALVTACWLDRKPYFRVHDWWDYFGRFLQIKYKHNPAKWQAIQAQYSNRLRNRSKNGAKGSSPGGAKTQTLTSYPLNLNPLNLNPLNPPEESGKEKPSAARTARRRPVNGRALEPSKSGPVWAAYAEAYLVAYGVAPTRNAKVNTQLRHLVERLGREDATAVAGWYPSHRAQLYVHAGHCTDLLLRDAEKLRTEWARGRTITTTQARQIDQHSAMQETLAEAKRLLDAKYGGGDGGRP